MSVSHARRSQSESASWSALSDLTAGRVRRSVIKRVASLSNQPVFCVVIDARGPATDGLAATLAALSDQLYRSFRICILCDTAEAGRLAGEHPVCIVQVTPGMTWQNLSMQTELSPDAYVLILAEPGRCGPALLSALAVAWNQHPDAGLVYFDDDIPDAETGPTPTFKKGWDPRLLLSWNYVGYTFAIRESIARDTTGLLLDDPSWPYGMLLHAAAVLGTDRAFHLPYVLFHRNSQPVAQGRAAAEAQQVRRHLAAAGRDASVGESLQWRETAFVLEAWPRVSAIIPTRDHAVHLRRACEGLWSRTDYPDLETIIVDNGSRDPETLEFLNLARERADVIVLGSDVPFNFSALNNMAARHTTGEVLLLLNNDIEVLEPDWLRAMVSEVAQPGVGAVGALLSYPGGRIQHAGILLGAGSGVAGHLGENMTETWLAGTSLGKGVQQISAVTAACMVTKRAAFDRVGGFDETFAVDYNDVDYCLRLRASGYRVLFCPRARLVHHESVSRGRDATPSPQALAEFNGMFERWGETIQNDAEYPPTLALTVPGFEFTGQTRVPSLAEFLTEAASRWTASGLARDCLDRLRDLTTELIRRSH